MDYTGYRTIEEKCITCSKYIHLIAMYFDSTNNSNFIVERIYTKKNESFRVMDYDGDNWKEASKIYDSISQGETFCAKVKNWWKK